MRPSTFSLAAGAALLAAPQLALASLASLRATIPGSLHQCEATSVFLFDSSNERPVTLVFLPAAVAPSGTTTLQEALALGPYQVVEGITTPDAAQYNFVLAIAEGESFATLGFFADGTGKNLNLPRTVQKPLPQTVACNAATAATAAAAAAGGSSGSAATTPAWAAPATTTTTTTHARLSTSVLPVNAASTSSAAVSSSSSFSSSSSSASSSSSDAASPSAAAASAGAGNGATGLVGSMVAVLAAGAAVVAAL
ncbi:hypothetical protein JCM11251_005946 [Rhodosporidiobolus azoricus]